MSSGRNIMCQRILTSLLVSVLLIFFENVFLFIFLFYCVLIITLFLFYLNVFLLFALFYILNSVVALSTLIFTFHTNV